MEDLRSLFEEKPELGDEAEQSSPEQPSKAKKKTTATKPKKPKKQVLLEGYVEAEQDDLSRTKSLTDEDLDELKGCLDLGFGFSYDEIPELCNTLPALELCYSMSQRYIDDHRSPETASSVSPPSDSAGPIANWRISAPGRFHFPSMDWLIDLKFFFSSLIWVYAFLVRWIGFLRVSIGSLGFIRCFVDDLIGIKLVLCASFGYGFVKSENWIFFVETKFIIIHFRL